jgi:predicted porin
MKHKLLPLLIAGASLGAVGTAFAGAPTVYGKVNVTLNKYDLETIAAGASTSEQDNWKLESNASRLGIKGDFDISEGLKAIYKLEYEVFVDDGQSADGSGSDEFNQRNIYGGLQGSFGTVLFGKHDTPLKLVQTTGAGSEIDRFNDLPIGDIKNFMVGENRESNIIMYTTPSFSGFAATLSIMPGEQSGTSSTTDEDGVADRTSVALTYNAKMFYVGLAADRNVQNTDIIRLAGEATFGPVKVGALYQTAEEHDDDEVNVGILPSIAGINDFDTFATTPYDEQDAWLLGAEWKIVGNWKLKAQYGMSESSLRNSSLGDTELTQMALGVDYKLNDNSKVFAYYASINGEGDSVVSNDEAEDKTFAVGYELKF